eukprot:COSAG01_NODE_6504_length_3629_cov_17.754958_1_plen_122_part_00
MSGAAAAAAEEKEESPSPSPLPLYPAEYRFVTHRLPIKDLRSANRITSDHADNVNRGPRPQRLCHQQTVRPGSSSIRKCSGREALPSTNRSARQQLDQKVQRPRSGHFIVHTVIVPESWLY